MQGISKRGSKNFTSDRGKEFDCYPLVENSGISFFCVRLFIWHRRNPNEIWAWLIGFFLPKEHITKRGNSYARITWFKCIHYTSSNSYTIRTIWERKKQSPIASTKSHAIASIHRIIRTMYYFITHNKLYDFASIQNR